MKSHRASELFPALSEEAFAALCEDMEKHGQKEAIVVQGGAIIDGRHRMRACKKLGIEPVTREVEGDPFDLVMSLNFHRRHLKSHEQGDVLRKYMAGKESHGATRLKGRPKKGGQNGHVSVKQVAEQLGIPRTTVRRHIKASQTYDGLPKSMQEAVDSGECPIEIAAEVAAEVEEQQLKANADQKTRELLAKIEQIEEKSRKAHQKELGLRRWLRNVEDGCMMQGKYILSRKWHVSMRQCILMTCRTMVEFAEKMEKELGNVAR